MEVRTAKSECEKLSDPNLKSLTAKTIPDSSRAAVAQSPFLPGSGHHYPCPLGYPPSAAPPPHRCPLSVCPTALHYSTMDALWHVCTSSVAYVCTLSCSPTFLLCDLGQGNKAWSPRVSDGDADHTHHSQSREKGPRCAESTRKVLLPRSLMQRSRREGPVSLQDHCCSGICGHRPSG